MEALGDYLLTLSVLEIHSKGENAKDRSGCKDHECEGYKEGHLFFFFLLSNFLVMYKRLRLVSYRKVTHHSYFGNG